MDKLKELISKHFDILSYLFFGGLTTLVNYLVYLPCFNWLQLSASVSNAIAWVFAAAFACAIYLSAANGLAFADCIYETISAIATVGLSTGLTASVDVISKLLLIVLMFFGRVGVMTISLGFLLSDRAEERYQWAETKLLIG